jgi:hypothetical protein
VTPVKGQAYRLAGIEPAMWGNVHPVYGTPRTVAGLYLGSLVGERTWHGFEIWADGMEVGVIFMNQTDLDALDAQRVSRR